MINHIKQKERVAGVLPVRPKQMVAGGGVFSEGGRGHARTGPVRSNSIISEAGDVSMFLFELTNRSVFYIVKLQCR